MSLTEMFFGLGYMLGKLCLRILLCPPFISLSWQEFYDVQINVTILQIVLICLFMVFTV